MTAETAETGTQPRSALRLLMDPAFGALFWGKLFSAAGVWTHNLVAAVVVFEATGSALMVGLLGVAMFVPQLVLNPLSGKWADRGDPIRQVMIGRVVCLVGSGSLALWSVLATDPRGLAAALPIIGASAVVGVGFVVGGPAMQSIVPSLLRPGELSIGMNLNTAPMTVARIGGPVLGAFLLAHLGPTAAFAVSAATHLAFIVMLLIVTFPRPKKHAAGTDYRISAALRYVWADRPLFLMLLGVTIVGFASDPSMTLAPSMAAEFGGGASLVGYLTAAFGVGAAAGLVLQAFLTSRVTPGGTAAAGLWLMVLGTAGAAVSPWISGVLAAFAIAGCGFSWGMTGLSTLVQSRAPDELRGRIMSLWLVGFLGSRPIAAALLGSTADLVSVRAAFLVAAVISAAVALLCRAQVLNRPGAVPLRD
ncbi:MFS transporter [Mycolicibacterium mengxianglii]|uniref:MFS transporter n=1 Tax=Mycolicibacterium mengxianglii TaxID=2736649 RepID=UPI001E3A5411|nr:MFS transporter [Mycolicibacterium mengxianglii]